jgi:hypothetical protein
MKISINDQELFTLSDTQKRVLAHEIPEDILEQDLKRRIEWVLMHKYEQVFKSFKEEWDQKLKSNGVKSVPTDEEEYAQLVFSQQNYQNRVARDKSSELK